jgi:uncharacterized membrane protein
MAALTKNKIGLSMILVVLVCFISLPSLTLTASAQPMGYQTAHDPFNSVVKSPDFSVSASPSYLSTTAGLSVNTTILVMPRYSFNGTVSLSASVPAGWTATFIPSSLSLTNGYYGYNYYGYYNYGSYNWSTLSVVVPSGAAAGKYLVAVTGTNGTLAHSVNVTVNVVAPDFRINAYPSSLSVTAGSTGNSTIMVTPLYGFNSTVSLAASVPAGWAATFAPVSLSLTNGYYGYYSYGCFNYSKLSVAVPSGTDAGKYLVAVTGTNGTLAHSVNVTVNVVAPDFRLYVYPSYLSVSAGSSWNSTALVSSLYGFSGTVSLSASCPSGWTATFASSSLSLTNGYYGYYSYGGSNYSKLSLAVPLNAANGTYTIVVTGTSGSLTHSVNVTVNVVGPDFRLSVYPSRLSVAAGSTWGSSVMVSSLYVFSGTVSLSASVPIGWTASFNPSSLSLTNGYYNGSALSLSVPSDAAAGKYTVVVTGTSGTLTHSANVTITVGSFDFWRR